MKKLFENQYIKFAFCILVTMVAASLNGIAYNCFYTPNGITPGGFTGLATIFSDLMGGAISPSVLFLIMNAILFVATIKFLGLKFGILTLIAVGVQSFAMEYVKIPALEVHGDILLGAILGGCLTGIGFGLGFWAGGSTGGTDFIVKIVNKFFPSVKNGQCSFAINAIVIALSMIFYGVNLSLYAIIAIFLCGRACDMVLSGSNTVRAFYIICDKEEEVAEKILQTFHRGVTKMDAEGAFSHKKKTMLVCLVPNQQAPLMKSIVRSVDPNSFVYSTTVKETHGESFFAREASVRKHKIKRTTPTLKTPLFCYRKRDIKKTKFKLCRKNRLKQAD